MAERTEDKEVHAFLEAARHGDRQALDDLLSHFVQPVYRFGMQMCRDEEDAKEVLQDTLLAAARTVGNFRGDASVSTWLYTIARSFCIKRRRRSKHAPTDVVSIDTPNGDRQGLSVPDNHRAPDEIASDTQLGRALAAAIDSLEPSHKEVLLLRDVEGLTAPEVANVLGIGVEAVKSRLHRARVAVREKLAAYVEEGPAPAAGPGCVDIISLYSQYLEGDVDADTCARMEKHLASCERCSKACSSLRETLALCKTSGPRVPPHVQEAIREAVKGILSLPSRPSP